MTVTLEIEPPEERRVSINGEEFSLLLSDVDILDAALQLKQAASALQASPGEDAVVATARSVTSAIGEILGPGAVERISGGKPVTLDWTINLLTALVAAVGPSYSAAFDENYG